MVKIGRLYSSIIYQNVGILITLGLIRVLFGEYGWWPNTHLFAIYNAMILYLVPCLLAYTGGRIFGKDRGGIAAAMAVFALALSSHIPMIIGAIILGPPIGLVLGYIEKKLEKKIPLGFEMFFGNVLVAVIALVFMVISYEFLGMILAKSINAILVVMEELVNDGWLPLTAFIIEPLKVLFLNNVINHGILVPIGVQEAKEAGKSIFFLIEDNPGPGLGILLAYILKTSGENRRNAKISSVIHFLGGIHEVYFPYVLQNPLLIISAISGGLAGNFIFEVFHSGLVSVSSPGSFILMIILSPKGTFIGNILGILLSAVVSFGTALVILHFKKVTVNSIQSSQVIKSISELNSFNERAFTKHTFEEESMAKRQRPIQKIVFACEAGMGSSALGAALLKKHLEEHHLKIEVSHSSVDKISENADLIITHHHFYSAVKQAYPEKLIIEIESFVNAEEYMPIIQFLKNTCEEELLLGTDQVIISTVEKSDTEAIKLIGQKMIELGFTESSYIDEMVEREKHFTTYLGKGIAIPHGLTEDSQAVKKPGIVIAMFPQGVFFGENVVYLAIGIAGFGEKQVEILSIIATLLDDDQAIKDILESTEVTQVIDVLRKFGL